MFVALSNRPFNNPTETYRYYSLPFCQSHASQEEEDTAAEEENMKPEYRPVTEKRDGAVRHRQRLGESIVGDRRETSPYEISFQDSVDWRLLCKTNLDTAELEKLKKAIQNNYFFEMFVEDLPMWGYIGDTAEEDFIANEVEGTGRAYLFPHLHFYLGYNKNKIVSAKVTTDVSCWCCGQIFDDLHACTSERIKHMMRFQLFPNLTVQSAPCSFLLFLTFLPSSKTDGPSC